MPHTHTVTAQPQQHYFITRHPGALVWLRTHTRIEGRALIHLDKIHFLNPGDCVYGILPVNLIASICAKGARYFHLCMDIPVDFRGVELTCAQMEYWGAYVQEFTVLGHIPDDQLLSQCPEETP